MTRCTPERGYGLDLSGPEPVWRGKRPGWNEKAAGAGFWRLLQLYPSVFELVHRNIHAYVPRYRIDEYIKRGLIDPARRDDL